MIAMREARVQGERRWVWNVVTGVERYSWRSDLRKAEARDKKCFVEDPTSGYPVAVAIPAREPCKRRKLNLKNSHRTG